MERDSQEQQAFRLAADLVEALGAANCRLALAESCTGGWVSKLITDVPGSSSVLECSFVSYSNAAKSRMLQVPSAQIDRHGAVSGEVVEAMAIGALANSQADIAAAVSGIAGPGGGTSDKPVGMVWFAWIRRGNGVSSLCKRLSGNREAVRLQSVMILLEGILSQLDG